MCLIDRVLRLTGLPSAEAPASDTLQAGSLIERYWDDGKWYDAVVGSVTKDKYVLHYPPGKTETATTREEVDKKGFQFGKEWRVGPCLEFLERVSTSHTQSSTLSHRDCMTHVCRLIYQHMLPVSRFASGGCGLASSSQTCSAKEAAKRQPRQLCQPQKIRAARRGSPLLPRRSRDSHSSN